MSRGVIYVAYGERARDEFYRSHSLLLRYHDIPVSLVSDRAYPGVSWISFPDLDRGARQAKLSIDLLSPYDQTLYLDADTRPYQYIASGFHSLDDGWDLAICPSTQQGSDFLWRCSKREIAETMDSFSSNRILSLQGGVMFFSKNNRVHAFFARWREEWAKYKDQDQGAMIRSLAANPLKVWLLGRPWNGGAIIGHVFGRAARKEM